MAPVKQKRLNNGDSFDTKKERKKWKEQKLLKAAGFKKGVDHVTNSEDVVSSPPTCSSVADASEIFESTHTISIAVPGSILSNAQTAELRAYVAGQIARAACIYRVSEVIVFDDVGSQNNNAIRKPGEDRCAQFCRLLQYLECPQYLRKHFFPLHKDLQYAGIMNPLDAPHHLRQSDDFPFREGVVSHHLLKQGKGSFVNVGLIRDVGVDRALVPDIRVTVKLLPQKEGTKKRFGVIVPPTQPTEELGVYWGYKVRFAPSLSDVFTKAPYEEGYDLTIGTSDKGKPIEECEDSEFIDFKHMLLVFGGLAGLEAALECDENLDIDDVTLLFDKYLNTCPDQGSRTIRTEEAVLISLAEIRRSIKAAKKVVNVK